MNMQQKMLSYIKLQFSQHLQHATELMVSMKLQFQITRFTSTYFYNTFNIEHKTHPISLTLGKVHIATVQYTD